MQTPDLNLKALFFEAFARRPRPDVTRILRPAVRRDGDHLRDLLAEKTAQELSVYELRTAVESNLWKLAPEAFLYFLPAFLHASLERYESVSVFTSELVGALTEPSRADVEETFERLGKGPPGIGLPAEMTELLRKQQLEFADSGAAEAIFHERFDGLTHDEGAAILAFFTALEKAHDADFPFQELQTAVDRRWARYRAA